MYILVYVNVQTLNTSLFCSFHLFIHLHTVTETIASERIVTPTEWDHYKLCSNSNLILTGTANTNKTKVDAVMRLQSYLVRDKGKAIVFLVM